MGAVAGCGRTVEIAFGNSPVLVVYGKIKKETEGSKGAKNQKVPGPWTQVLIRA